MSRLSREKKREEKRAARSAVPATPMVAPLDVRVPAAGPGAGGASIGGVPVVPAPGEEVQHAVLSHLHRIALASGHPVLATVQDDRIGYVVPLRVDLDGSSHFTGEPVRSAPPEGVAPAWEPQDTPPVRHEQPTHVLRAMPERQPEARSDAHAQAQPQAHPEVDAEPQLPGDPSPTFRLRAVPESPTHAPYGTAVAPTGEFGPPPTMDGPPPSTTDGPPPSTTDGPPAPDPSVGHAPAAPPATAPEPHCEPHPEPHLDPYAVPDPDPKPTPARGFDAVAEAVLGDDPLTASGDTGAAALLAEPMARIADAVKAGEIESAAGLAERTVAEASGRLGPEHPEVLRLLELTAYIAYLAGDPLRAFHLSLDLARVHRGARDAESAYGNIQSAASAWRAVRDPVQGLHLGQDLLGLWTDLTFEDGPAADDIGQLESARARMNRLAARAARTSGSQ
ncbi:tetratricopeptide repeat protein [Streptomyces sp. NPDC001315]|uniref:tetratricopeptide repeat protein n=1 Tax=Streptomyces sp. NPDC001315 TaxID=3364562 RepID=UPI00369DFA7E